MATAAEQSGTGPNQTIRCLNPISGNIDHIVPCERNIDNLQQLCISAVRKIVSLNRFAGLKDLPLPRNILSEMAQVYLKDFIIRPEEVTGEHHSSSTYPAKCLIDDSLVSLKVCSQDSNAFPDPSLMLSFTCNNVTCNVYQRTQSLSDVVASGRQINTPLQEAFIWKTLHGISSLCTMLPPHWKLHPKQLHFFQGMVFYKPLPPGVEQDMAQVLNSMETAFYEAPDIMMQMTPSIYSQSWTIGCLLYEMMALEPLFYDREGAGNLMEVMQNVMEVKLPPPTPSLMTFSPDLIGTMAACIQLESTNRPQPQQIVHQCQAKLQQS